MDLVVSLDTEADDQWRHGTPLSCGNVEYWQAFQALCEAHDILPTYLLTSEMAENRRAAAALGQWVVDGRAEAGAHLHSWTTPPFVDAAGLRFNDALHVFERSLPDDLLRAKLETLTRQIAEGVGVRPLCYRAGRFGIGQSSARILAELGYVADSSVTPLVSWRDESLRSAQGEGPDFRRHSAAPFVIAGSGQPGLLELPVTVILTSRWVRRHPAFTQAYLSRPARGVSWLLHRGRSHPEPTWLRPFPHQNVGDLKRVWWAAQQEGLPTAVMMFHSSELMPGASPYRPTRRSVTGLLATLDEFFRFVVRAGGTPVTMSRGARRVLAAGTPERRAL